MWSKGANTDGPHRWRHTETSVGATLGAEGNVGPHSHLFWVLGPGEGCLGNGREPEQPQGQHGK